MLIIYIVFVISVTDLGATSNMLMDEALKTNTKRTYSSAQTRFLNFCVKFALLPMPVTEETLLLYIAFLFEEGLSGSTIRVYLSAVRSMHVFAGKIYPINLLRVKLSLKGAVRKTPLPTRKLPITISVLRKLIEQCSHRFDKLVMIAAMTLSFFGCLRLGEVCVPDLISFSSAAHLCLGDITIDSVAKSLQVFLKRSKTDVYNRGVTVFIGCSGDPECCAYCAMSSYLKLRVTLPGGDNPDSPLFIIPGGKILLKSYMISATRLLLSLSGFNPSLYSGHSFRAGAATTAGDRNFRDWELKMFGPWKSNAYTLYLRDPKVTVAFASRLMADA
jgi:hypothetical protein